MLVNEATMKQEVNKKIIELTTKLDEEDGRLSNYINTLSNMQSFDFEFEKELLERERSKDNLLMHSIPQNCGIFISFTSIMNYKNFQIMRNNFKLIFKVSYPEEFFKKVYDGEYFTLFGMEKSSRELVCFAIIDLKMTEWKAEILALGVVKEFQNKKIGTNLLKKVLEELTTLGIKDVKLIVQKLNLHAINLYEKFGFKKHELLPEYYNFESAEENNAYIMIRYLNSKKFWIFDVFKKISQKFCFNYET